MITVVRNFRRRSREQHAGFSLLEVILFLGILSIILGTAMAVSISTEEARIRQRSIAEVEQRGTQILETVTKSIRRSEAILSPAINQTGSVLALQMTLSGEFPTIFAPTASGNLLLVEKSTLFSLLSPQVTVSALQFQNVNGKSVFVSFDIQAIIPLVKKVTFSRHFEATATLFQNDQSTAGGCGSCPVPVCQNHTEKWYECEADACTLSVSTFAC